MKSIIFDLDQTLVDTSTLKVYRNTRNWKEVYCNIHNCYLYDGMTEVFKYIRDHSIKVCIVSSSPRAYLEKIIGNFNIPADYIIGYHDTFNKKPHPEPMQKALSLLNCDETDVISFGDRDIDIIAAQKANILAIGCAWGSKDKDRLAQSQPHKTIYSPKDIIEEFIKFSN